MLRGVFRYVNADNSDDGHQPLVELEVLAGLGFHQRGHCRHFLGGVIHNDGLAPPHQAVIADAVLAGNAALKGFHTALHFKAAGVVLRQYIQLVALDGAVQIQRQLAVLCFVAIVHGDDIGHPFVHQTQMEHLAGG